MKPIYDLLGVTVGILQSGQHDIDKQEAYSRDVVYGTNSEFGFDYLRDNLADRDGAEAQRGHGFAIVDEVDNILIDEARTPLIISGQPSRPRTPIQVREARADHGAGQEARDLEAESKDWEADFDFEPDEKHKTVSVTERGVEKAEKFLGIDNLYRAELGRLVNHLQQSLKAEALYKKDVDYAVIDGEGQDHRRVHGPHPRGPALVGGLHQAVEAKEGVAIQEENADRRHDHLPELLPPLRQARRHDRHALTEATEFMKIYDLQVGRDPHEPADDPRRQERPDLQDQGRQVGRRGQGDRGAQPGQPVLVGTISVEVSEVLSQSSTRRASSTRC